MIHLSIIVPTVGRPTLMRTLESLLPQLHAGDEVIILRDDTGDSGNSPRDRARASGTHIWFLDDDDVAAPQALAYLRRMAAKNPKAMWVFRMLYPDGEILWKERSLKPGNVGTPCILIPNNAGTPRLPNWTEANDELIFSDIRWIQAASRFFDVQWAEDVVAHIRP